MSRKPRNRAAKHFSLALCAIIASALLLRFLHSWAHQPCFPKRPKECPETRKAALAWLRNTPGFSESTCLHPSTRLYKSAKCHASVQARDGITSKVLCKTVFACRTVSMCKIYKLRTAVHISTPRGLSSTCAQPPCRAVHPESKHVQTSSNMTATLLSYTNICNTVIL